MRALKRKANGEVSFKFLNCHTGRTSNVQSLHGEKNKRGGLVEGR